MALTGFFSLECINYNLVSSVNTPPGSATTSAITIAGTPGGGGPSGGQSGIGSSGGLNSTIGQGQVSITSPTTSESIDTTVGDGINTTNETSNVGLNLIPEEEASSAGHAHNSTMSFDESL
jgi:hypothetical protein